MHRVRSGQQHLINMVYFPGKILHRTALAWLGKPGNHPRIFPAQRTSRVVGSLFRSCLLMAPTPDSLHWSACSQRLEYLVAMATEQMQSSSSRSVSHWKLSLFRIGEASHLDAEEVGSVPWNISDYRFSSCTSSFDCLFACFTQVYQCNWRYIFYCVITWNTEKYIIPKHILDGHLHQVEPNLKYIRSWGHYVALMPSSNSVISLRQSSSFHLAVMHCTPMGTPSESIWSYKKE